MTLGEERFLLICYDFGHRLNTPTIPPNNIRKVPTHKIVMPGLTLTSAMTESLVALGASFPGSRGHLVQRA